MPFDYKFKPIKAENLSKFLDNIFSKIFELADVECETNPLITMLHKSTIAQHREIIEKAFEDEVAIKLDTVNINPREQTLNAIIGFSGSLGYMHKLHITLDKSLVPVGSEYTSMYLELQRFDLSSNQFMSTLPEDIRTLRELLIAKFHFSAQEELYKIFMDALVVMDNGLQDLNPASSAAAAAATTASDLSKDDEELQQALGMSAQAMGASAAASAAGDLSASPTHSSAPLVILAPRAQAALPSAPLEEAATVASRTIDAAFSDSGNTLAILGQIFDGLLSSTSVDQQNLKKHLTSMLISVLKSANPGQKIVITSIFQSAASYTTGLQDDASLAKATIDAAFSDGKKTLAILGHIFHGVTKTTTIAETKQKQYFTTMLAGFLRDSTREQRDAITTILDGAVAKNIGLRFGAR